MLALAAQLLIAPALADRFLDVTPPQAEALVAALPPGTLLLTWCNYCAGGPLRVVRVRTARVAPGRYLADEGYVSVVVERDLLFDTYSAGEIALPAGAPCGSVPERRGDVAEPGSPAGDVDHIDVPYGWTVDRDGKLAWLGRLVGDGATPPSPATSLSDTVRERIRSCLATLAPH
ncbi:MAG: hypothetical protein R3F59_08850 [Myxococcota bacterium]